VIRIGAVSYLNTRPLVFGMEQGLGRNRIELSYDVPAVLAERMRREELDVALMPVVALAEMPELELVPGLGIVTYGPSRSVLLLANRPLDEVRAVGLDPESRTSNALTRILFQRVWPGTPVFEPAPRGLDEALERFDAVVRIGDKALFEQAPHDVYVHDLGGVWTADTGLPFVFAAWIARPGVVYRVLYRMLHTSRREGSKMIPLIADDYSWQGLRDPQRSRLYLERNIRFKLGSPEVRAMELFFRSAAKLGLIDRAPTIKFVKLGSTRRSGCHETAARQGATR
jgi:chorismate dehydratase